jgi:hypothetical protein
VRVRDSCELGEIGVGVRVTGLRCQVQQPQTLKGVFGER